MLTNVCFETQIYRFLLAASARSSNVRSSRTRGLRESGRAKPASPVSRARPENSTWTSCDAAAFAVGIFDGKTQAVMTATVILSMALTPLAFLMSTMRNARMLVDRLALALGLVLVAMARIMRESVRVAQENAEFV